MNSIITGVGSYLPSIIKKNSDFLDTKFLNEDGSEFEYDNAVIIEKFKDITGISERRYAESSYFPSDLGFFAAQKAIENAKIDPETIDYIIVAHNFGDVLPTGGRSNLLPSVATKIKNLLRIKNPNCVAYDILFGCPGWLEGVIQANMYMKVGEAKRCLIIGTETLSRVVDAFDRDSMIYSDGAGACILETSATTQKGILSHATQTFSYEESHYLFFDKTYKKDSNDEVLYMKMKGRKIYEFALNNVPNAMKKALDKSGKSINDVVKIFIHQANEKMDEAIVNRFYRLFGKKAPNGVMPMSIHKLGNSSVATIPTLLDLVMQNKLENQSISEGDLVIFASVGSGMNINAVVYQY